MGQKHKEFKGISEEALNTKWKGVEQVYDIVRKKAQYFHDEKRSSAPPSKDTRSKTKNRSDSKAAAP